MCKAFVYCRQSSGDDDFSESVETQRVNCLKLAEKNKIEVVEIFSDLNSSGKLYPSGYEELSSKDLIYQNWLATSSSPKKCRVGLGKLFKALSETSVSYIIVDDYTRLARPLTGSFLDSFITQILFSYKLKILTVKSGELDLNSFNDSLIMALQNRINDNQIAIQRKKAMDSRKRMKDGGVFYSGLAITFGFRKGTKKYELVVDENEKEVIKFAYKMALARNSQLVMVQTINKTFPFLNNSMDRTHLKKILKRPYYCGYTYNSEGELIESKQLKEIAFISFEDWSKVQEIFDSRVKHKQRTRLHWNPLSGYIRCGICHKPLIYHSCRRNAVDVYACYEYMKIPDMPNCRINMAITQDREQGVGMFEAITPLFAVAALNKLKNGKENADVKKKIEKIEVKLHNLKEKEEKVLSMFVADTISEDALDKQINAIKSERKNLNADLISLKNKSSLLDDEEIAAKHLRNVVAGKLTKEEFEDLLKATIKEILVWPDKVLFKTYFGDIELPRKHLSHFHLLPRSSFHKDGKKLALYYYHKNKLIANPYSPNLTTIFKNDMITIYYEDMD